MNAILHKITGLSEGGRYVSLLTRLLQAFFFVLIGWFLVRAFMLWVTPQSAWTSLPAVVQAGGNQSSPSRQSFDFPGDPFRLAGSPIETSQDFAFDPGLDVPETSLDLILKGQTVGNPGSAILQTPDNKEASYRVGDEVIPGVTLHSVSFEYVVLDVRGDLQRLTFAKPDSTGLAIVSDANANDVLSVRTDTERAKRQITETGLQNAAVNVQDLMSYVRFNPKFERGELIGYVVQSRGDESKLTQFGLQSGDAITAIDGDSLLQGAIDPQALVTKLRNTRSVTLNILRGGRPQTIKIGP